MSATILPMRAQKPALVCAHPGGVALVPDPDLLGAAAYAIASLAGEDWNRMTPSKLDEYRAWALLAASCGQSSEGLRMAAYSVGKTSEPAFVDMPAVVRRSYVDRMMGAIRGAALRVHGVCNPQAHADLVALMKQDAPDTGKGQW